MTGRKIAAIAGLVLLALAVGLLVRVTGDEGDIAGDSRDRSDSSPPPGWELFSDHEVAFTFRYPPEAIVDRVDPAVEEEPSRVRVRLIGPESGEGTEITDGFTLYVRLMQLGPGGSLRTLARRLVRERDAGSVEDSLVRRDVHGRVAYRFSTRSELGGEVEHVVVRGNGTAVFAVSYVISGPADRGYGRQIRGIIGSLERTSGRRDDPGASTQPPSRSGGVPVRGTYTYDHSRTVVLPGGPALR